MKLFVPSYDTTYLRFERFGKREVPGSGPVNSNNCEDNFSQLNPYVLPGFSITQGKA